MKIDHENAWTILRAEAEVADSGELNNEWLDKVKKLSELCEARGRSKTHIAFFGTALLAKATDPHADLFAIKPDHAPANGQAFSARTLCHGVLVPAAAELGFSIGVTGREPLNNQPYFRMTYLGDGTPVRPSAQAGFDYMVTLIGELDQMIDAIAIRHIVRAFIAVRKSYMVSYGDHEKGGAITPDRLLEAIAKFVEQESEGGRRAQAVVAGLMDAVAEPELVESGRVNDPSRKHPGDVCVRSAEDPHLWQKAVEVRDKPVSKTDVQIFAKKCIEMGVRDACVMMASPKQARISAIELTRWGNTFGLGVTLFHGWEEFVDHSLFWSPQPKIVAASMAANFIHDRLIAVEVSPDSVAFWRDLTNERSNLSDE